VSTSSCPGPDKVADVLSPAGTFPTNRNIREPHRHLFHLDAPLNLIFRYVYQAAAAGHATFRYDRLGTGLSEHPYDGWNVVQPQTDVDILFQLIAYLRSGKIGGKKYTNIVGVGHSYGSVQLTATALQNAKAAPDALVLTGFSANTSSATLSSASFSLTRAADGRPREFGALPGTYVYTGLIGQAQLTFLNAPYFAAGAGILAYEITQPVTLGVFITYASLLTGPATEYTGRVLIVTGAQDIPFCGGNCYAVPPGSANNSIPELAQSLFPKTKGFAVAILANTGHGISVHYSAAQTYRDIQTAVNQF